MLLLLLLLLPLFPSSFHLPPPPPDMAIVYYQSALRLKPYFTDAYNNMASALVHKGLIPQAMECYMTALRINPGLVREGAGVWAGCSRGRRLWEGRVCCRSNAGSS
jgi:tetratricopeptide (TPR) repeat protein